MTSPSEELVPCFMPSLAAVLLNAEKSKGNPLTLEEVLSIRDSSACIMMKSEDVRKMDDSRGYRDLDPENCWFEWQMLRREMGLKPDVDPGASISRVNGNDSDYQMTIRQAQDTLEIFASMLPKDGSPRLGALIKAIIYDGQASAFMWLTNVKRDSDEYRGDLFEIPPSFHTLRPGDSFSINSGDILDWMINEAGKLYGGYSLRFHRSRLSPDEALAFDEHIGVSEYL